MMERASVELVYRESNHAVAPEIFIPPMYSVLLPAVLELIHLLVHNYEDGRILLNLMNFDQLSQVCTLFNLAVEANQLGLQVRTLKTSHPHVVDDAWQVFRPFVQQLNSDDDRWLTHPID